MAHIGFARVTAPNQDLETQQKALTDAGCTHIFISQKSGKTDDNAQQLAALIDHAQKDDTVVLTKLYRLGHSAHKVLITLKALMDKGVAITTLDGQLATDSDEPTKQALTQLLVIFADLERDAAADKQQNNQNNQIQKIKKNRKAKPLNEAHIGEVQKLYAEGASKSQLSKQFRVSRDAIMQVIEQ
ncbi:MAG: DNA invertase Pin-like site-specific DNA recombinase [Pseudohongiellaceae bacterium]|jgi:DNA invertase Pin-like site-specific DNA recombinase